MDVAHRVFVDLPEKDRAVQLAAYIAAVRGEPAESSAIVASAKQLAQADDVAALTALVIDNAAALFGGPEKGVRTRGERERGEKRGKQREGEGERGEK